MSERESKADLIRRLRTERKLSQKDLAAELKTTRHVVLRWEGGQEPDFESARKLGAFFGLPPERFFTPRPARADRLAAIEGRLDRLEAALASIERHLPGADEAPGQ